MTADKLAGLAGVAISLILSYTPGLRTKYQSLSDEWKALIALAVTVLAAVAIFFLSCQGVINEVECTADGAWGLAFTIVSSLSGLGSTFVVTRKLPGRVVSG